MEWNSKIITTNTKQLILPSEISEEDRTFFMVLDINFSQYNLVADIGYYYEAECEDTFSFNRFEVASEYFHYYRCHQALKPLQRIFVKYVNISKIDNQKNLQQIKANILKEFNLISNYNGSGLVNVFLIFCRKPNVFYLFLELPDETLEEYLIRHSKNNLLNYSSQFKSFRLTKMISVSCFHFIIKTISTILLELHNNGIYHGRLTADSVFIFNKQKNSGTRSLAKKLNKNNDKSTKENMIIKLANFSNSEVFEQSNDDENDQLKRSNKQSENHDLKQLEDYMRTRELLDLYDLVTRIIECTEFDTFQQQEKYIELASTLIWPTSPTTSNTLSKTHLESFLEFLWNDN